MNYKVSYFLSYFIYHSSTLTFLQLHSLGFDSMAFLAALLLFMKFVLISSFSAHNRRIVIRRFACLTPKCTSPFPLWSIFLSLYNYCDLIIWLYRAFAFVIVGAQSKYCDCWMGHLFLKRASYMGNRRWNSLYDIRNPFL